MHKRITLALTFLVALTGLAGLAVPGAQAAGPNDPSGSTTLQLASDLPRSHGIGRTAAHGYLPLHPDALAAAKAAADRRAGVRGGAGQAGASGPSVTAYPNVSPSFAGTYQSGLTPPDTTGAIGPDRYIETVNTSYAIYNRSGSQLSSGSLSALTGISTGFFGYALSDPQMMWDPTTQRFYYVALYYDSLFMSDNGLAIGWSKTATPATSSDFCQYTVAFGSDFPDYPKLGDSHDFLVVGYNDFVSGAATYAGSAFMTVNKPAAGSSCLSAGRYAAHFSGTLHDAAGTALAATPVPANLVDNATGAGYVVANPDLTTTPSASSLSVYPVTTGVPDANGIPVPIISGARDVSVSAYSIPANAPQAGSSYLLDTLDGRLEAAVAAVDPDHGNRLALWTAHAVNGGPGAEERWYEIDPATGALLQSGTVGGTSLFAWNGAVSPDRADNGSTGFFGNSMAMSVSTSSAATYPAIRFVWKAGTAPQSALSTLVQAAGASVDFSCASSTNPQPASCRWGDYSAASPDPAATGGSAGRVWLGNQYDVAGGNTSSTVWRTWLFAVTPTGSAPGPLATLAISPTTANVTTGGSQTFALTGLDTGGNPVDVSGATWTSTAPGSLSSGTGASSTFTATSTGSGIVTATLNGIPATATVTVVAPTAPPAPTNLLATPGRRSIALSWIGSSGAAYKVYRGTVAGGTRSLVASVPTGTAYNDTGLKTGRTYYYQVSAVLNGVEGPRSIEVSATAK